MPLEVISVRNDSLRRAAISYYMASELSHPRRKGGSNVRRIHERLIELIACWHDDEDVHIAVFVGRAVGIGPKKNDLVRLEAFRDLVRIGESPTWARRLRDTRRTGLSFF